jgi:Tfp pilus assembly protein PilE
MLKLLNTKLLIAILAVLAAIASAAIYQRHEAVKAAAVLEQRKQEDEAFRKKVEADKQRHNSAAGNEGKTWKSYIP